MADIVNNLPDAYVKDGKIRCMKTDIELPNYEGLCGTRHSTIPYVMYTHIFEGERKWHVVHPGIFLDMKAVEEFFNS